MNSSPFMFRYIYPQFRYFLSFGRKLYTLWMKLATALRKRPASSPVIPDAYQVHNTTTVDSEIDLICLQGTLPTDLQGALFIAQCLGTPEAFMVGDTNIVRIEFSGGEARLTNRLLWTPAALARRMLANTRHRFDFFGLMYLSPGLGLFSYTEGLYLLPDGRIAVTSDLDRPWAIGRDTLRAETPIGRRDEWIPMMIGQTGEILGSLFAGYSNSHVMYTDFEQNEVFLVNYRLKQPDGSHPVYIMRWDGSNDMETWLVVDETGAEIEIKQSLHELVFTQDYILLADTAFVAGPEMFTPWVQAPLPAEKTVVYIIDRRDLQAGVKSVAAKQVVVDEPCIHLIAEYENPGDKITVYMLHTPGTNTAEILRRSDRDLKGSLFPDHLIGHGTLPVLDLSSIGKHVIAVNQAVKVDSSYLRDERYSWGPYLYAYMGRQLKPYNGQDLFVMFKGFSKALLPRRIYKAYKNIPDRRVRLEDMVDGEGLQVNNAICRIGTDDFSIADAYVLPDRVLLYTIACLDLEVEGHPGYLIAGVVTDDAGGADSSGHEYWLFAANDLAKGPICKLGHPTLNNSTLFHTVYLPAAASRLLDQKAANYYVPLREDYPAEELRQWSPSLLKNFEQIIWPYFDLSDIKALDRVEAIVREFIQQS